MTTQKTLYLSRKFRKSHHVYATNIRAVGWQKNRTLQKFDLHDITTLDQLVLTVRDLDTTCRFYESVLNMEPITFGTGRRALRFGQQKVNLHTPGAELRPTRPLRSVYYRDPDGSLIEVAGSVQKR